jgi:hypothetical protein
MQLPKEFTTVTTMSKLLALVVFVTFPLFGFLLGMNYQAMITNGTSQIIEPTVSHDQIGCTMDARICPDGSAVGRMPPNCEFAPCPVYPNPTGEITPSVTDSGTIGCIDVYGGMAEGACASVPPEGRACQTDLDCTATCSRGCINANWTPNTRIMECMAEPMYSCACVNQICIKAQ